MVHKTTETTKVDITKIYMSFEQFLRLKMKVLKSFI
jgi:hypothetical protein